MSGDDIDPVQFGRLLELGEQNRETMLELKASVKEIADNTSAQLKLHDARLGDIELRDEKRKHLVLGALGAGTLGGATLGDWLNKMFKHLW